MQRYFFVFLSFFSWMQLIQKYKIFRFEKSYQILRQHSLINLLLWMHNGPLEAITSHAENRNQIFKDPKFDYTAKIPSN